ncbi:DUF433 domain-containing protein [Crocosphaera watsonii WH 8501]|uniref:DUF433 domain-containing protein n=4 Tax=Crocosphaera watsonii TaxID=263511 RepID=Q4C2J9_CROWT|nr:MULTISPECIES: DUF433 domain-containing protein [Crocosphaera]EAM50375.1 Protein of unknown function DUF433 [Crocosphaera watsonii WH 8501]EHJ12768.1 hypothetical protein CWATWH0003_2532 [Crocosphaera watsonii WH 0003]MCH2243303.1 DUF433 domain-containing protein [Crocosphaera sp.]NQZ62554.1 DUF433 domain-containing protein [Crocosphaera sp.]CCQ62683.1 hypothetical protein CWATWH0401_1040 [Crocosphaera watsonii WH 0401]
MVKQLDRITFEPKIMMGKACIRGMRIPVSLILNLIANGKPNEEILDEYPDLELEDIKQCLLYAAWLADERIIPIEQNQKLESVK